MISSRITSTSCWCLFWFLCFSLPPKCACWWLRGPSSSPTEAPSSSVPTSQPTSLQPTLAPTTAPTPPPSASISTSPPSSISATENNTSTSSPSSSPTSNANDIPYDEIFTIIVMSDMENRFRGHSTDRSRYVAQYIRDVQQENLSFDGEYSHHKINPQLIIHNGDISRDWGCDDPIIFNVLGGGGCRTPDDEVRDVWQTFYDAGIPMISTFGNHDWRPRIGTGNPTRGTPTRERDATTDQINQWSSNFTQTTYEKSAAMGAIEYEAIPPTGRIGQNMYRSTFRGIQLASFNAAYNWQSYDNDPNNGVVYDADDQFHRFASTLDRTQPTIFFSHFPLSATRLNFQTPNVTEAISLLQQFPRGVTHFSGHYHAHIVEQYQGFADYVAPYPHSWAGREPGYLAVLVSPKTGVVQVKSMTIPGLEDGMACIPTDVIDFRNQIAAVGKTLLPIRSSRTLQRFGNWVVGSRDVERGCDRCKAGRHHWSLTSLEWQCGRLVPALANNLFSSGRDHDFSAEHRMDSLDDEEDEIMN